MNAPHYFTRTLSGRTPMTPFDAYLTAQLLAAEGRTDSDAITRNDLDTAADLAGARRPETETDRHTALLALDALAPTTALRQDRGL